MSILPIALTGTLIAAMSLLAVTAGAAGVYKWTDDKGKVHFSDRPVTPESKRVSIKETFVIKHVPALPPIEFIGDGAPRGVILTQLAVALTAARGQRIEVGQITCGRRPARLYWRDGRVKLHDAVLAQTVAETFDKSGYSARFGANGLVPPGSLRLSAKLVRIRINYCPPRRGAGATAGAFMAVKWALSEPVTNTVVFTQATEGSAESGGLGGDGIRQMLKQALAVATQNLLAEQVFVAFLSTPVAASEIVQVFEESMVVPLQYGTDAGSFQDQAETLQKTSVVVRTATGHGSGVIISAEGHVLTNAHVVGKAKQITVKSGDHNYIGTVLRIEPVRDVALIKIERYRAGIVAPVATAEPALGSEIYVIGTPLSEVFSHSVTRGIVSAVRMHAGQSFVQTDAAINRGNSGGPVFSADGELVGLTVSGIFAGSGASLNINYFIPIHEAIEKLGIESEQAEASTEETGAQPTLVSAGEDVQDDAESAAKKPTEEKTWRQLAKKLLIKLLE